MKHSVAVLDIYPQKNLGNNQTAAKKNIYVSLYTCNKLLTDANCDGQGRTSP